MLDVVGGWYRVRTCDPCRVKPVTTGCAMRAQAGFTNPGGSVSSKDLRVTIPACQRASLG